MDSKVSQNHIAALQLCPDQVDDCHLLVGVRLRDGQELKADLVVDASGRRSKLPSWLEEAGYQPPEETHVDSHIGYSMRLFELPEKASCYIPY